MEISDKKRAIFESALELIREHGFHGAPMSLVAKNADVATGTIYHYFESKDQLICELYSYNRQRVVDVVNEALAEDGAFKEKFIRMWKSVFRFYSENTSLLIFFEQYVNSPFNAHKIHEDYEDRPLYTFLMEGIEKGILRKIRPDVLMIHVIGTGISQAKLHQFGTEPLNPEDIDLVVEMVWEGISGIK